VGATGRLRQEGWDAVVGYPGNILDKHGGEIEGFLFSSERLVEHWSLQNPGFGVDIVICADLNAFTHVLMGYENLDQALKKGSIAFEGSRNYVQQLPSWLYLRGEVRHRSGLAPSVLGKMA
jgi:hypothetical protein